jgi:hypothetical protein
MARRILLVALSGAAVALLVASRRRGRVGDPETNGGAAERTERLRREVDEARERLREDLARAREE